MCCWKRVFARPVHFLGIEQQKVEKTVNCDVKIDCGSDHELLITKFRLKLKKVGKTTRPFRYDLNQTLYNYTVEVRNRFKGLDLIDHLMN